MPATTSLQTEALIREEVPLMEFLLFRVLNIFRRYIIRQAPTAVVLFPSPILLIYTLIDLRLRLSLIFSVLRTAAVCFAEVNEPLTLTRTPSERLLTEDLVDEGNEATLAIHIPRHDMPQ